MLAAQGDLSGALALYHKCLEIVRSYETFLKDANWFYFGMERADTYRKIGQVLQAQDDLAGALEEYRKGLLVYEQAREEVYDRPDPLSVLALCHTRVGDVLLIKRDLLGALAEYQKELEIRQRAVQKASSRLPDSELEGNCFMEAYPGPYLPCVTLTNSDLERELSVSREKIGDVLLRRGMQRGH